jgi:hypothetical protein
LTFVSHQPTLHRQDGAPQTVWGVGIIHRMGRGTQRGAAGELAKGVVRGVVWRAYRGALARRRGGGSSRRGSEVRPDLSKERDSDKRARRSGCPR